MNPYDEQRLRNEVIYLHSLWRQGPPGKPDSGPKPNNATNTPSRRLHLPADPTPFKKEKAKKKKRKRTKTKNKSRSGSDPSADPGPKWPVNEIPSRAPTGWPELKPYSAQAARTEPLSEQEQAKFLAMKIQHEALESACEFFSERFDQESDEEMELEDEDYLTENDGQVENEEYNFFLELFINDDKLRGYYENNYESGDFCCLVCRGIGEKVNKRYKDCLGLVRHATAVSKTKRKRAHRAFGQVVCKVLGWDSDRLPVIVLKGEPLGRSLATANVIEGTVAKESASVNEHNMTAVEGSSIGNNGETDEKVVSHVKQIDGQLTSCQGDVTERNVKSSQEHMTSFTHKAGSTEGRKAEIVEKNISDANQNHGEVITSENSVKVDDVDRCDENPNGVSNAQAEEEGSCPSSVSNIKWPFIKPVDATMNSGWPTSKPQTPLVIGVTSAEEQERLAALQLQRQASETCREFFDKNAGSDGNEDDSEDEDYMGDDELEGSKEFKFLLQMFMEKSELKDYYQKKYEDGEFHCLVCSAIGEKAWKRFKDCHGLLQHSTATSKTKKKRAHRALALVICKVLGWDTNSLPATVLKGDPLGRSGEKLDVPNVN